MKIILNSIFILSFVVFNKLSAQETSTYQTGEWLRFRIHYGWFNASEATLKVEEENFQGRNVHHITGHGESTGLLGVFFKVDDTYKTYIDKESNLPVHFIRKINEGGYKKHTIINFDHLENDATVHNKLKETTEVFSIRPQTQDLLSAFYFLRNKISDQDLNPGDKLVVNMFFDNENYKFVSKFLGKETLKTKFGKIECLKFRPYVQAGRVFKEKESLTFWVSADKNHIPIKIKAELAVGSLEADLAAFKGLKYPFKIIVD
ncbi:MAG TPA: DUF3108 domain-containing protein [Flavobacteriaceae bacterium]|nr:DUF3108 domain-containing protein [Flavobacteriaceae bacterium]